MGNIIKTRNRKYSLDEIEDLRKKGRIILIANKRVYDVTDYIDIHPGSRESILRNMYNKDNKDSYNFHSNNGQKIWEDYFIGVLNIS
jgi:cytochrome b involved in lipid metabolism